MKKILLLTAVTVFAFGYTSAQELKLGAKAGVNFAKLAGDNLEDADGRTGFHIGVLAEIPITEKFAVQPELIYSQQGLQTKTEVFGQEFESKLNLDYINIPVMAKYYIIDNFSVEVGPQFGINVKAESETNVTSGNDQVDSTLDVSDAIETLDISLGAGVAYDLPMGVFFQARYMFGVTNISEAQNFVGDELTNSNLSISVGYKF